MCLGRQQSTQKIVVPFGRTCFKSLIPPLGLFSVVLLIMFSWFWRILHSKAYDESTVWPKILFSAAGPNSILARPWTKHFLQKTTCLYHWSFNSMQESHIYFLVGLELKFFNQKLTKKYLYFFHKNNQTISVVMQKNIKSLDFVRGVNIGCH